MANWYDIPGIEFHFVSPFSDSNITYKGVRDNANVDVEDSLWSEWYEIGHEPGMWGSTCQKCGEEFASFMRQNEDWVKGLIESYRA